MDDSFIATWLKDASDHWWIKVGEDAPVRLIELSGQVIRFPRSKTRRALYRKTRLAGPRADVGLG